MAARILIVTPNSVAGGFTVDFSYSAGDQVDHVAGPRDDFQQAVSDRIREDAEQGTGGVLIDLKHYKWLTSRDIGLLVTWRKVATEKDARIAFAPLGDRSRDSLEKLGLLRVLPFFDSVAEAIEYLHSEPADT